MKDAIALKQEHCSVISFARQNKPRFQVRSDLVRSRNAIQQGCILVLNYLLWSIAHSQLERRQAKRRKHLAKLKGDPIPEIAIQANKIFILVNESGGANRPNQASSNKQAQREN